MVNVIIPKEKNATDKVVQHSFAVNMNSAEHREAAEIIARRTEETTEKTNKIRRYF